jgi:branched-subunit amino acid ABC-type transport system permease component
MPPVMITQPIWAATRTQLAYSGINSQMIILGTYLIEMLLVGIGGILIAFYTNSISSRQPRLILRED